jgi:protein-disulfide isomerase/uncharacterized membrane protein
VIARSRLLAIALLMLVSASLSTLLLMQHHGESLGSRAVAQVCGEGEDSGCDTVNRSPWSAPLGVPLAGVGIVFALGVGLLALLGAGAASPETRRAVGIVLFAALAAALAVDLLLLGVQAVAIKAFCKLCVATSALNAVALALVLDARRELATAWGTLAAALASPEGRLVRTGLLGGLVIAVAAVTVGEAVLSSRADSRGADLFKAPAGPAAPADLAGAQAEVRRLQDTLDDPRKLEKYFQDKAVREFESAPAQAFALDRTPLKGTTDAAVKVVEFSDFLCPFCRNLARGLSDWMPETKGRVAIYFKNYPLDKECNSGMQQTVHPGACYLAYGAVCAQEQGRFWPYHDRVFAKPLANPKLADVAALAQEAGLDRAAMEACLATSRPRDTVAAEIAEAVKAQVSATPTLFVQGRKLPRIQDLPTAVDRESVKLGLAPLMPAAPDHH